MTELEILRHVIRTLDSLSVSGADNMKKLLGCLEALNQIVAVEEATKGSDEDGRQSDQPA